MRTEHRLFIKGFFVMTDVRRLKGGLISPAPPIPRYPAVRPFTNLHGGNNMKTTRLRQKVKEYLKNGPKSTAEILEHINTTSRHGTTTQQLGNILAKDRDIVKVGYVRRVGSRYGSYHICEWNLRELVFPVPISS